MHINPSSDLTSCCLPAICWILLIMSKNIATKSHPRLSPWSPDSPFSIWVLDSGDFLTPFNVFSFTRITSLTKQNYGIHKHEKLDHQRFEQLRDISNLTHFFKLAKPFQLISTSSMKRGWKLDRSDFGRMVWRAPTIFSFHFIKKLKL